jgi:hypothetical protein
VVVSFDKVDHGWLVRFVEHRIADQRIVRLIRQWLKAGVMEDGRWFETEEGTPQGSVISPILANLYLHYVLDVWVVAWRKKVARGEMIVVRYADDAVLGFQHREDAERFLKQLQERMGKFGLELHPEKTRLIEFGRYATERRAKRGEGKPETFNFLGFTHICGTSQPKGYFTVRRKTIGKRMAAKLKGIRETLRQRMHENIGGTLKWLQSVVRGYFQYHAGQRGATEGVSARSEANLAADATATESEEPLDMGAIHGATRQLATGGRDPTSVSDSAFRRQTSQTGTVCVSRASTGLCGGQRVTAVPTATAGPPGPASGRRGRRPQDWSPAPQLKY